MVHDITWGIVDPPGLPYLRFLFDHSTVAGGNAYDLAEELLVDLAQDLHRHHRELVRALRVVEPSYDPLQRLVFHLKLQSQTVRTLFSVLLFLEVEEA